jgi:hypothetical protein
LIFYPPITPDIIKERICVEIINKNVTIKLLRCLNNSFQEVEKAENIEDDVLYFTEDEMKSEQPIPKKEEQNTQMNQNPFSSVTNSTYFGNGPFSPSTAQAQNSQLNQPLNIQTQSTQKNKLPSPIDTRHISPPAWNKQTSTQFLQDPSKEQNSEGSFTQGNVSPNFLNQNSQPGQTPNTQGHPFQNQPPFPKPVPFAPPLNTEDFFNLTQFPPSDTHSNSNMETLQLVQGRISTDSSSKDDSFERKANVVIDVSYGNIHHKLSFKDNATVKELIYICSKKLFNFETKNLYVYRNIDNTILRYCPLTEKLVNNEIYVWKHPP